ncbi:hypothetical protein I3843_01G092900 [Carya illinoinensis]|nr:hypothetical protein I3843_01G092900 [Carya illinoinensis]
MSVDLLLQQLHVLLNVLSESLVLCMICFSACACVSCFPSVLLLCECRSAVRKLLVLASDDCVSLGCMCIVLLCCPSMCLCSCCVQSNRMMIVFAVKACVKAACVHVGRLHGLSESMSCELVALFCCSSFPVQAEKAE